MPEEEPSDEATTDPASGSGAIDYDILERISHHLDGSARFATATVQPEYAPNSVVAAYDTGYFPTGIADASMQIRWFDTNDFSIHYSEQYDDGSSWECRWDRHPNEHNSRNHFHPPPDAETPGEDAAFARDWRDVLARVLRELDQRIEAFWD